MGTKPQRNNIHIFPKAVLVHKLWCCLACFWVCLVSSKTGWIWFFCIWPANAIPAACGRCAHGQQLTCLMPVTKLTSKFAIYAFPSYFVSSLTLLAEVPMLMLLVLFFNQWEVFPYVKEPLMFMSKRLISIHLKVCSSYVNIMIRYHFNLTAFEAEKLESRFYWRMVLWFLFFVFWHK